MPSIGRPGAWSVVQWGFELRISFDDGASLAQYIALHLDSSYLRLCPSPDSGWGTSVVLLPALWSREQLFQGAALAVNWQEEGSCLRLSARGRIGLLDVDLDVRFLPPAEGHLSARVSGRSRGKMILDRREGEAFRIVTLSSMKVSDRLWDASSAYADGHQPTLGQAGWIVDARAGVLARRLGLVGGSSDWKANAPTVEIELDRRRRVGGWLTRSTDPTGDNVSLWAAAPAALRTWSYTIHAWRPPDGSMKG